MAPAFPKYVVLQSKWNKKYMAVAEDAEGDNKDGGGRCAFTARGDQVLSPLSKFNLEKAKTKKGFFNIRSCYNNKYWAKESVADSSCIVLGAAEPNEDPSQWSSTLVELVPTAGDVTSVKIRLVYDREFIGVEGETQFTVINWESLMNLPKYVVLKGDNGKYLKVKCWFDADGHHVGRLKFDGSDIGDSAVVHQVLPVGDGTIMMKPMMQPLTSALHWHHWTSIGRFGLDYQASRFMPVKAGSNSIALRFMDNNLFCRRCDIDDDTDRLVPDSESITKESRFIVEEPLLSRDIFDMDFRLKHARIYDQDVVTMSTSDATNLTSSAETFNLRLTYTETSTKTWDRSLGLKLGFSATMKAGVPLIAEGEVKLSSDFEGSYKWGDTQQTSTQTETIHTVTVPPKTRVKSTLLATRGKCEVPFSYTVRDVLIDGQEFIHILDDGIYTGTNTYNFKVQTTEEKLL